MELFKLGKLKEVLLTGGVGEENYRKIKAEIDSFNLRILNMVMLVTLWIMVLLFECSFFLKSLVPQRQLYVYFIGMIVILKFAVYPWVQKRPPFVLPLIYAYEFIAFAFSISLGTIYSVQHLGAIFFVLLALYPQMFIDRPYRIHIFSIAATLVFIFCSFVSKNAAVWEMDFADSVMALGIALLLSGNIVPTRIRYLVQEIYIKKEQLNKAKAEVEQSRIEVMLSQIKPHFIFNMLNAIAGLCLKKSDKAYDVVILFSQYLRNNIEALEKRKLVPFSQELQNIELYVQLENIRFNNRVTFTHDIRTGNFNLPTLTVEPLVENAIKHGLKTKRYEGTVQLNTWQDENYVYIQVKDDGYGFDEEHPNEERSKVFENVKLRLQYIVEAELEVDSDVETGTNILIRLPQKEIEENADNSR